MVLNMENAMVITPAIKQGRTSRICDVTNKIVTEEDKSRFQQFKWKIEDSTKRISGKGGHCSSICRPSAREEPNTGHESGEESIVVCPSVVTDDWRSVLRPISLYKEVNMIRSFRDLKAMTTNRQAQPLTTVHVRWQNNRHGLIYSPNHLMYIFSHFGNIIRVTLQSPCSAHVTFESIAGACRAISMKNTGVEGYPLHVCWLPKAWQNAYWKKKDAVPKTYVIKKQRNQNKNTLHSNQIHSMYHTCAVKGCPNQAVMFSM